MSDRCSASKNGSQHTTEIAELAVSNPDIRQWMQKNFHILPQMWLKVFQARITKIGEKGGKAAEEGAGRGGGEGRKRKIGRN